MVNEFFSNLSFIGLFLIGGVFVLDGSLEFSTLMAVVQLSNGVQNMYWTLSGDPLPPFHSPWPEATG
jgi:hypothetical protein